MLIKATFILNTDEKNHKLSIKMQFLSLFADITKIANFWCNMLMTAELKGCVTYFISLGSSLDEVVLCYVS